jgi:hypothetical protein
LGCVWSVLLEPLKPILPAEDQEITHLFVCQRNDDVIEGGRNMSFSVDSTITLRFAVALAILLII